METGDKGHYAQPPRHSLLAVFFLLWAGLSLPAAAQQEAPAWDELTVYLHLPGSGGADVPALLAGERLYLSVADVFGYLQINHRVSPGLDTVEGFFIDGGARYRIDLATRQLRYRELTFELGSDGLIRAETALYLRLDYFGEVFGLAGTFQFRSLSVALATSQELPLQRAQRLELLHRNLQKLRGEVRADTTIAPRAAFLLPGAADWSVVHSQAAGERPGTRLQLRLGGRLAGGEATVGLRYDDASPFTRNHQFYRWRYVNNSAPLLRQVSIGTIAPQPLATVLHPVTGIQVSNTPTISKRAFGHYTLSDRTEPGWTVELYVNHVLVDHTLADAAGRFTFQVPLMYGQTLVQLRFYGPSGEARTSEDRIAIPFSFLPQQVLEYSVSAGLVGDSLRSRLSRVVAHYGFSRRLTAGAGVEYLSSLHGGRPMPFLKAALRLHASAVLSTEYMYGVLARTVLNYRRPSNLQLDLTYIRYAAGQQAVRSSYREEGRLVLSMPLRVSQVFTFSRLSIHQAVLPAPATAGPKSSRGNSQTTAELSFSATRQRLSASLTTYATLRNRADAQAYSSLALACQLKGGLRLRSQLQYDYSRQQWQQVKGEVEKPLRGGGLLTLSYDHDWVRQAGNLQVGFRYDFSFARAAFSAGRSAGASRLAQAASGSLLYDAHTRRLLASPRSGISRSGITLAPFLDINCNGRRDPQEPGLPGLKFRMQGGRIQQQEGRSLIRIVDLEPYMDYLIELDGNSFPNIAWKMGHKRLRVRVEPGVFTLVEVPVAVLGEVSGTVCREGDGVRKGLSRLLVHFYDSSGRAVASTLTEGDGYFSYLGLPPGTYTAALDTAQLAALRLTAAPHAVTITIAASEDGVVADGIEFVVRADDFHGDQGAGMPAPAAAAPQQAQGLPAGGTRH